MKGEGYVSFMVSSRPHSVADIHDWVFLVEIKMHPFNPSSLSLALHSPESLIAYYQVSMGRWREAANECSQDAMSVLDAYAHAFSPREYVCSSFQARTASPSPSSSHNYIRKQIKKQLRISHTVY